MFGRCPEPGVVSSVEFHDRVALAGFAATRAVDALVVIPDLLSLLMPIPARSRVVWTGNAFAGGDCALSSPWVWAPEIGRTGRVARLYPISILERLIDRLVVKSEWQAAYVGHLGVPVEKVAVIYNGVPLEHYDGPPAVRHPHRLVYASQPRRGLDVLLRLFPRIRAVVDDAELHVFGYDVDLSAAGSHAADQPGVVVRGRLTKSALAREFQSAAVMAYPCTFKETFCTAVAEAQAAGLPVVTADRAALRERVTDGVDGSTLAGAPGTPEFDDAFVAAVVNLLVDESLRRRQATAAATKARQNYDWADIAGRWEWHLGNATVGLPTLPPVNDLDLLAPTLLRIEDRGHTATVPPSLAAEWLLEGWASYGFDPRGAPIRPAPR